ncbi:MAG: hypothetical protein A3H91_09510 [Gammaproteobacteria bacterium RIFCSPLOWO2_02_FULL_61_13]|nr:MAG: hypothetical protein A3H91_09510 [Gammaproteobacteria bacterium RIFCSPLOWO2_02_FULL_61_13]
MTLGTGGLVVAYVLVTALLLALLFNARGPWWSKAAVIAAASIFYVLPYVSWPALLGWPTVAELPPQFNLVGMYVQPPDSLTGSEGVIYLWATEVTKAGAHGVPRAYKFGYSVAMHENVTRAGDKLSKNIPQMGKVVKEKKGKVGRFQFASRLGQKSAKLEFYDAPAPSLPDK